jgi:hypothetical protein
MSIHVIFSSVEYVSFCMAWSNIPYYQCCAVLGKLFWWPLVLLSISWLLLWGFLLFLLSVLIIIPFFTIPNVTTITKIYHYNKFYLTIPLSFSDGKEIKNNSRTTYSVRRKARGISSTKEYCGARKVTITHTFILEPMMVIQNSCNNHYKDHLL